MCTYFRKLHRLLRFSSRYLKTMRANFLYHLSSFQNAVISLLLRFSPQITDGLITARTAMLPWICAYGVLSNYSWCWIIAYDFVLNNTFLVPAMISKPNSGIVQLILITK